MYICFWINVLLCNFKRKRFVVAKQHTPFWGKLPLKIMALCMPSYEGYFYSEKLPHKL